MADRPYPLALIAHDGKKDDLLRFAKDHLDLLRRLQLVATATTGSLLSAQLGLEIQRAAAAAARARAAPPPPPATRRAGGGPRHDPDRLQSREPLVQHGPREQHRR